MTSCYQKVKCSRAFAAKWGFAFCENEFAEFTQDDQTFKMISHVFALRWASPTNTQGVSKLYSSVVKNIAFEIMVRASRMGLSGNMEAIKQHIYLSTVRHTECAGYHEPVCKTCGFVATPISQRLFTEMLGA